MSSGKFGRSLEAVNPSSFARLKAWDDGDQCPLPLLWKGAYPLPSGAKALLGEIVHHVMQYYGPASDPEDLWRQKENEIDRKLQINWISRGLSPIEKTASGYTFKKKLCLTRLQNIQGGVVPQVGNQARVVMRDDEMIESRDRKVRGKPDLVIRRGEEYTIIDYKSGDIFEDDPEGGEPIIKGEYRLQLALYAALLRENGKNIRSAILQTIDGKKELVGISHDDDILSQASLLLDKLNKRIEELGDPTSVALPKPGNPKEGIWGCFGCRLRPVCGPYCYRQAHPQAVENWPKDLFGIIAEKSMGHEGITLQIKMPDSDHVNRVLLNGDAIRHPSITNLKDGDCVGIFNVISFRGSYLESPQTCVYQYMKKPMEEWQLPLDILGKM
ncbi:MAG: hypothetical protein EBT07_04555 [Actinobacteria bacterium]|nr:hypothetical protein [Actinomycetota bacterium]